MVKQANVKPATRFGGGGVSKSASDFVNTYAYKVLTDKETLKVLSGLPISVDGTVAAIVTMEELAGAGYNGKDMGSALQRFNSVFACGMRIPFRQCLPIQIEWMKSKLRHKSVLKIYRTGEEFDASLYSTTEAGRVSGHKWSSN